MQVVCTIFIDIETIFANVIIKSLGIRWFKHSVKTKSVVRFWPCCDAPDASERTVGANVGNARLWSAVSCHYRRQRRRRTGPIAAPERLRWRTQWATRRRTRDIRSSRRRSPWCRRRAAETLERRRSSSSSLRRSAGLARPAPDSRRRWSRTTPTTGWRWGSTGRKLGWESSRCRVAVWNESQDKEMNLLNTTQHVYPQIDFTTKYADMYWQRELRPVSIALTPPQHTRSHSKHWVLRTVDHTLYCLMPWAGERVNNLYR